MANDTAPTPEYDTSASEAAKYEPSASFETPRERASLRDTNQTRRKPAQQAEARSNLDSHRSRYETHRTQRDSARENDVSRSHASQLGPTESPAFAATEEERRKRTQTMVHEQRRASARAYTSQDYAAEQQEFDRRTKSRQRENELSPEQRRKRAQERRSQVTKARDETARAKQKRAMEQQRSEAYQRWISATPDERARMNSRHASERSFDEMDPHQAGGSSFADQSQADGSNTANQTQAGVVNTASSYQTNGSYAASQLQADAPNAPSPLGGRDPQMQNNAAPNARTSVAPREQQAYRAPQNQQVGDALSRERQDVRRADRGTAQKQGRRANRNTAQMQGRVASRSTAKMQSSGTGRSAANAYGRAAANAQGDEPINARVRAVRPQSPTSDGSGYVALSPIMALELAAPHTWVAAVMPTLVALCAAAAMTGKLPLIASFVCLLIVILMQSAVNTINDYYDYVKGADSAEDNVDPTDAVLVYNNVNPSAALGLAIGEIVAAFLLGVYIIVICGWIPLIIALVGASFVFLYSAGKTPISYLPLGEITSGVVMGGLIPLAVYIAATGTFSWLALLFAIPEIIGVGLIMMTNNTCDIERDVAATRHTLPTLLGRARARAFYHALVIIWLIAITLITGIYFTQGLFIVPFMLLAAFAPLRALLKNPLNQAARIQAMGQICSVNVILGAFYCACILAGGFIVTTI